jgi:serine/threonine protein kinase
MSEIIETLGKFDYVHGDLKPENILVEITNNKIS